MPWAGEALTGLLEEVDIRNRASSDLLNWLSAWRLEPDHTMCGHVTAKVLLELGVKEMKDLHLLNYDLLYGAGAHVDQLMQEAHLMLGWEYYINRILEAIDGPRVPMEMTLMGRVKKRASAGLGLARDCASDALYGVKHPGEALRWVQGQTGDAMEAVLNKDLARVRSPAHL